MPYVLHAQVKMKLDLGCKMHRWGIIMAQQRGRGGDGAFSLTRYGEFYGMPIPGSRRPPLCPRGSQRMERGREGPRGALQLALGSYHHREEWVERAGRRVNVAVRTAYKPVLSLSDTVLH